MLIPRHLSANLTLMRAHFDEEAARAALLLEQAAWALLRASTPQARKWAFHLVLAGLRFHACKQKRLAIHCYLQVGSLNLPLGVIAAVLLSILCFGCAISEHVMTSGRCARATRKPLGITPVLSS